MNKLHKQTLALASLLQSATLVDQLALVSISVDIFDKSTLFFINFFSRLISVKE
jgi:CII-binding regulator of phage lambda lysogenization HflD